MRYAFLCALLSLLAGCGSWQPPADDQAMMIESEECRAHAEDAVTSRAVLVQGREREARYAADYRACMSAKGYDLPPSAS